MIDKSSLVPLSSSQMQLWIGQKKRPASPMYNMAYAYRISQEVDLVLFQQAWSLLAQCTDTLKTRIIENGESVSQHFIGGVGELQIVDFSIYDSPIEKANTWMQQEVIKVFDLTGSLVTSALLKISTTDWVWYCQQHHLITDAWSFQLLWEKLARIYFAEENSSRLTNSSQYKGFIEYEQMQLNSAPAAAVKHWSSRQDTGPLTLYGRENPGNSTHAHRIDQILTKNQSAAFVNLCKLSSAQSFSQSITRVHILLAVYAVYLNRVSGSDCITLYTPLLNRSNPALRETIGLVTEIVPLKLELNPADCFETVVGMVRKEMTKCLKNTYTGVATKINQPNCTAIFNYISNATSNFGPWPADAHWLHSGHNDSHHVIRLHFTQYHQNDSPSLLFEFNSGSFTEAQCKAATLHWWRIYDAVAADSTLPIGLIGLCDEDSDQDRTDSWSAPVSNIPALVASTVARFPLDTAVADAKSKITYQELGTLASSIKTQLSNAGVCTGDRVMVVAERSIQLPAVFIAILQLGAVYVPIDPLTPTSRIKNIIDQCSPKLLLTSQNTIDKLPSGQQSKQIESLLINTTTQNKAITIQSPPLKPSQLAYIMFTSGSTGTPKGVMISHGALANYIQWAADFYSSDQRLTFPFYTSIGFDLTVTSLYVPLITGGQVKVYPESGTVVDLVLLDVIQDNQADIIKLTPAHLALVQGQDLTQSRVKQLIVGGEDLKTQLANNIQQAFPGAISIHNEYGPTEATVGCVTHTFDPQHDTLLSVPIGKPCAGTTVRIVNEFGVDQPAGVPGELLLSGPSLSQGYWDNNDETKNHFINTEKNTDRTYKSGDLVRILDNGNLIYLGRRDNQIKLNGHRIELAEIESACLQIPGITDSVANIIFAKSQTPPVQLNQKQFCCARCGLSSEYPSVSYDIDGVCHLCQRFEKYKSRAGDYFRPNKELDQIVGKIKNQNTTQHDCIVLLSGGKDSSYMLARLVDMGLSVLAFTLDNGYISEGAKENAQRICKALNVEHVYGRTDSMNDIFRDSLERHSNVCHGCFKTIYTLSLKEANDRGINTIFTGLSRGQFFETRLTEELFTNPEFNVSEIDVVVLNARKTYHQIDDEVKHSLETTHISKGKILDRVQFVDFYRYCDVNLDELLDYLNTRLPWVRPSDTGRSTNCLINDVGIYVHKMERGYHNYALPYSWDVRLGHKNREDAMDELNDQIDENHVRQILNQINYEPKPLEANPSSSIAIYYTSENNVDPDHVRSELSQILPPAFRPTHVIPLDKMPLNKNGKIDKTALPAPHTSEKLDLHSINQPVTTNEIELAGHWCHLLNQPRVDITSNFFALGGDSLAAIRLISRINRAGYTYTITDLFENPTVSALALLDRKKEIEKTPPAKAKPFSQLDKSQLARLANKLSK